MGLIRFMLRSNWILRPLVITYISVRESFLASCWVSCKLPFQVYSFLKFGVVAVMLCAPKQAPLTDVMVLG